MMQSDHFGEFVERCRDSEMTVSGAGAEFIVAATEVLHERVTANDHRSVFNPRIGRSLALSLPWSHSTRLFAYCSVL